MKKIITRVIIIAAICIFVLGLILCIWFKNSLESVMSLKKVDDYPLYTMQYYGDYHFNEFLKKGAKDDKELEEFIMKSLTACGNTPDSRGIKGAACSAFSCVNTNNETIFGRNFDFDYTPALILYTNPTDADAYASVSMVNLSFAGYNKDNLPDNILNRLKLLAAPYLPFDGMNEKGVSMALLSVPSAEPEVLEGRPYLNTTTAIRLVLDYAANTDEAVELLKKYNIYFSAGTKCHYIIADKSGKSVVVEYFNSKMVATPKLGNWQAVTNHILCDPERSADGDTSIPRYETISKILTENSGKVTEAEAMKILENVQIPDRTLWSAVYNNTSGKIKISMGRNYNKVHEFSIDIK